MSYCSKHNVNNCIECALERQTDKIVQAIQRAGIEAIIRRQQPVKRLTVWDILMIACVTAAIVLTFLASFSPSDIGLQ